MLSSRYGDIATLGLFGGVSSIASFAATMYYHLQNAVSLLLTERRRNQFDKIGKKFTSYLIRLSVSVERPVEAIPRLCLGVPGYLHTLVCTTLKVSAVRMNHIFKVLKTRHATCNNPDVGD